MIIRRGRAQDLGAVSSWLRAAGLPTADLTAAHLEDFLVAEEGGTPVGTVGLERFGDTGLLRSLVVEPGARGNDVGRQLVMALEEHGLSRHVSELWLLTIDADAYFSALGYEMQDRRKAPECIRRSVEFSRLCPGDAMLMRKRL
jgi:amino-acid N-acetyltransferase